jgi:hypothetical protein
MSPGWAERIPGPYPMACHGYTRTGPRTPRATAGRRRRGLAALAGITFVTERQHDVSGRDGMRKEVLDQIEASGGKRPAEDPASQPRVHG